MIAPFPGDGNPRPRTAIRPTVEVYEWIRSDGAVFQAYTNTGDPNGPAEELARALERDAPIKRSDPLMQYRHPRIGEIVLLRTAGPYIRVIDIIPDIPAFPVKSRHSANGAAEPRADAWRAVAFQYRHSESH
jgi:hypothetical protein